MRLLFKNMPPPAFSSGKEWQELPLTPIAGIPIDIMGLVQGLSTLSYKSYEDFCYNKNKFYIRQGSGAIPIIQELAAKKMFGIESAGRPMNTVEAANLTTLIDIVFTPLLFKDSNDSTTVNIRDLSEFLVKKYPNGFRVRNGILYTCLTFSLIEDAICELNAYASIGIYGVCGIAIACSNPKIREKLQALSVFSSTSGVKLTESVPVAMQNGYYIPRIRIDCNANTENANEDKKDECQSPESSHTVKPAEETPSAGTPELERPADDGRQLAWGRGFSEKSEVHGEGEENISENRTNMKSKPSPGQIVEWITAKLQSYGRNTLEDWITRDKVDQDVLKTFLRRHLDITSIVGFGGFILSMREESRDETVSLISPEFHRWERVELWTLDLTGLSPTVEIKKVEKVMNRTGESYFLYLQNREGRRAITCTSVEYREFEGDSEENMTQTMHRDNPPRTDRPLQIYTISLPDIGIAERMKRAFSDLIEQIGQDPEADIY